MTNSLTTTRRHTGRTQYRGVDIPDFLRECWYSGNGCGLTVGQVFARGVDAALDSMSTVMNASDDLYAVGVIARLYPNEAE